MINGLKKSVNVLTKIIEIILFLLIAWMTISLGIQVFARYLFHKSFVWSEESARYGMIWLVFIGAAEIIFNSEHIRVTVLEDLLRRAGKRVLNFFQYLAGLIFTSSLFAFSFKAVEIAAKATSSNMGLNMGIVYGIFPVVTFLMILGYIFRIILFFAEKPQNEDAEEGGDRK